MKYLWDSWIVLYCFNFFLNINKPNKILKNFKIFLSIKTIIHIILYWVIVIVQYKTKPVTEIYIFINAGGSNPCSYWCCYIYFWITLITTGLILLSINYVLYLRACWPVTIKKKVDCDRLLIFLIKLLYVITLITIFSWYFCLRPISLSLSSVEWWHVINYLVRPILVLIQLTTCIKFLKLNHLDRTKSEEQKYYLKFFLKMILLCIFTHVIIVFQSSIL
jgi:hypothetical protein